MPGACSKFRGFRGGFWGFGSRALGVGFWDLLGGPFDLVSLLSIP